jgi:hypothetical protein
MNRISELKDILGDFLDWNNARLSCFAAMVLSLFAVRTVNLREIAAGFLSDALLDSRYKRIKRFFAQFIIDKDAISRWAFKLFFTDQKFYLTIDRTNWFLGKSKINVLMVAMAYEGIAVTLCWRLLDKAGNATAAEHREIIEYFIKLFGKDCIEGILADREFGSGEFFEWCNNESLPFYIRIKEDSLAITGGKKLSSVKEIFNDLNSKEKKEFGMDVLIYGQKVFLAGSRSERGELMIVATNQSPKNAIAIYLRRWEIENLFQSLKSRGFRLS